jgi:hypothetical protein
MDHGIFVCMYVLWCDIEHWELDCFLRGCDAMFSGGLFVPGLHNFAYPKEWSASSPLWELKISLLLALTRVQVCATVWTGQHYSGLWVRVLVIQQQGTPFLWKKYFFNIEWNLYGLFASLSLISLWMWGTPGLTMG